MTSRLPAGLLRNEATGRFHPIIFRPAPLPGWASALGAQSLLQKSEVERYRSAGHHEVGFDTYEDALASITEKDSMLWWTGNTWTWDGSDVPAMTEFFPTHPCGPCIHAHMVIAAPTGTSTSGPGCLRTGGHATEICDHFTAGGGAS